MMLILSFIALVIGCTMLYMELKLYGDYPWWDTNQAFTSQLDPQLTPSQYVMNDSRA